MARLTRAALGNLLTEAGVERGSILHVQSDVLAIGLVDAPMTQDGLGGFYLGALRDALGPDGTLSVATAFEDYGRYGTPFVVEDSPSRLGLLSEHVRLQPGAVRSAHPIGSVTALGPLAGELCGGAHHDAYGWDSPWGELHRRNARIMTLGLGKDTGGLSFVHHVERLFGVPYQYTKLYDHPVVRGGKHLEGPFTMSVRYLDFGIADTAVRLKRKMVEEGAARHLAVGGAALWTAMAKDIVAATVEALRDDRWFLLEEPPSFRRGEIPWDGVTGDRVHAADAASTGAS